MCLVPTHLFDQAQPAKKKSERKNGKRDYFSAKGTCHDIVPPWQGGTSIRLLEDGIVVTKATDSGVSDSNY